MPGKKKTSTVHRLEDLEVHEVSIVDRPANLRPFLMVKNEDGEPVELERDAEGNLVARKKAAAPAPSPTPATKTDMDTITALIKALGVQLATLEKADPIAKRLAVPEELRSKAFKEARGAMQRIDTAMATMSMADISDDGSPEFMKLIGDELGEVSKILGALSRAFGKSPTTKSADALLEAKLEELTNDVNGIVEKAGRKMAARRLTAFRSALDTLTSVLNELDPPKDKSATKKSDETAAELEKARAELASLKKSLEGAGAKIEELTKTVKDQASQIRKAREARPASNAVTVEEVTKGDPSEADEGWPLDMNNEKSRRTVDKSVSFY